MRFTRVLSISRPRARARFSVYLYINFLRKFNLPSSIKARE